MFVVMKAVKFGSKVSFYCKDLLCTFGTLSERAVEYLYFNFTISSNLILVLRMYQQPAPAMLLQPPW